MTITELIDYLRQFDDPDNIKVVLNDEDIEPGDEFVDLRAVIHNYE
jgi:hypothetical protein